MKLLGKYKFFSGYDNNWLVGRLYKGYFDGYKYKWFSSNNKGIIKTFTFDTSPQVRKITKLEEVFYLS